MSEHQPTPERVEVPIDNFTVSWERRAEGIADAKAVLNLANRAIRSYGIELVATFRGEEADDTLGGKHDNLPISDNDLISIAVDRAELNETIIEDAAARMIAAQWQWKTLAGFASTGAIDLENLTREIAQAQIDADVFEEPVEHDLLEKLLQYVKANGARGPVEGWDQLWLRGQVNE